MSWRKKGSLLLVLILFTSFLGVAFWYESLRGTAFPKTDGIYTEKLQSSSMIKTKNHADYQEENDCSGYAIAYVLRSLGKDAKGVDVYEEIPEKNKDGSVTLQQVVKYIRKQGMHANLYTGEKETLQARVEKGVPVIVFLKSYVNSESYHYSCVVGYNEENVYLSDSVSAFCNESTSNYNRVLEWEEFEQLWTVSDGGRGHLYIVVSEVA